MRPQPSVGRTSGDALHQVPDAQETGDATEAVTVFGNAWLQAYSMGVDAEVMGVVGAFALG